ncbi:MAG: hypothetical protein WD673_15230 [Alphaproteobacteria bacterium]
MTHPNTDTLDADLDALATRAFRVLSAPPEAVTPALSDGGPKYRHLPRAWQRAADILALSIVGEPLDAPRLFTIALTWHATMTRRLAAIMPHALAEDMAIVALLVCEAAFERLAVINTAPRARKLESQT